MALKNGTVDAQENPTILIYATKLYEVQKYLSLTMHAYTACEVTMNLKKFQSFPAAQQKSCLMPSKRQQPIIKSWFGTWKDLR